MKPGAQAPVLFPDRIIVMAKKPTNRTEFVLFDVLYEDGSQRSNRKVPLDVVDSFEGEDAIRATLEQQDRDIAEKSGLAPAPIKSIRRSGAKAKDWTKAKAYG